MTYTFAGSGTQLYAGTELEDFLTQDTTLGAGVRQRIGDLGNLRAGFVASTGSEVWKDPYVVNADRDETDRKSSGARLGWENILGSDFDVTYTKRKVELDDELSGTKLGLNAAQRDLLNREGDLKKLDLSYHWRVDQDNILIPTVSYVNQDLDGDAMAMKGAQFELNYAYLGLQDWELVTNVLVGSLESDDTNPIYGKKADVDRYGVSFGATYKEPFGLKDWRARAAINYGKEDSNIDFYDTSIKSLTVGMLYNFYRATIRCVIWLVFNQHTFSGLHAIRSVLPTEIFNFSVDNFLYFKRSDRLRCCFGFETSPDASADQENSIDTHRGWQ
ncbi:MAG: DUF2860 family protein, partial [Pseudomonas sp.]